MTENYSVESKITIIGAGPAGLLASLWLIKSGTPHILIDANTFPRDKSCGDIITSKVIRGLNEIDAEIIPEMIKQGLLAPIKGTKIYAPNNKSIEILFRGLDGNEAAPSCYSVQRAAFDNYLLCLVKKSKAAIVMTECFIKSIKNINDDFYLYTAGEEIIKTKLIIGASGCNSNISKLLGALVKDDKHYAIGIRAYYTGIKCKEDVSELILDQSIFPGGFYITPLADALFNVNLVIRKDIMVKRKIDLKKQFEDLIKNSPLINEKFENAQRLSEFKGSGLFLGTQKRNISGKGYMLAGDAAGLIDLVSGNGIPQAMMSGKLAAQKALECLKSNNFSASFLHSYEIKLYNKIKNDLSIGKLINPILSYRIVRKLIFSSLNFLGSKNSSNSTLVNLLYDRNPIYTLFNPLFYYKLFFDSKIRKNKNRV